MNRIGRHALGLALMLCALASIADEPGSKSFPNVDELLKRVLERAKVEGRNDREFRKHYAYTRNRVTEYRSGNGKLRKREAQLTEHDPKPSVAPALLNVGTADNQRDGQTAGQEMAHDARSEVKGRAFENSDFPLTEELLNRFHFTLAGRERLNGRLALIMDFKPASRNLPIRNLKDRFINRAAGRVWVDEAESALVKADLRLTEPVNVIGGLVGAVHQCAYNFERERTPEGRWFTKQVNWRLEGRQLLVSKTIDYHETREKVRRVW